MNIATALDRKRSRANATRGVADRDVEIADDNVATSSTGASAMSSEDVDSADVGVAPEAENEGPGRDGGDDAAGDVGDQRPAKSARRTKGKNALVFFVLPACAMLAAVGCAYLKWQLQNTNDATAARIESAQAAKASTVDLLSYDPDKADHQLAAARELLTGTFRNAYTSLTDTVVIPAAKQKHISAVADVPAVASVSASPTHAVALVFVNQTTIIGSSPPTATTSVVRVTLDKVGHKWLIAAFDPV